MDASEIARLRALCEKAAPGPWGSGNGFIWVDSGHAAGDPDAPDTRIAYDVTAADGEFIAEARTALPAALDEIKRLRAQVLEYMETLAATRREREGKLSRVQELVYLLSRVVKYATEDRARTPRSTRLARVLEESRIALMRIEAPERPE